MTKLKKHRKAEKYLGVTIANSLTWSEHTEMSKGKANRTLGFLRRNINDCKLTVTDSDNQVKAASYTTMVRPILEYTCIITDQHGIPHLKDIQLLEQSNAEQPVPCATTTATEHLAV